MAKEIISHCIESLAGYISGDMVLSPELQERLAAYLNTDARRKQYVREVARPAHDYLNDQIYRKHPNVWIRIVMFSVELIN